MEQMRKEFEEWAKTLPASVYANIMDSLKRGESYTFMAWQAARALPVQDKDAERQCKNCRHWKNPEEKDYGEVPGTGKCKAVVQYWDATEWSDDGRSRALKPSNKGKLAFVQDGSDYYAELKTRPDFFCAHYEAIEAALQGMKGEKE